MDQQFAPVLNLLRDVEVTRPDWNSNLGSRIRRATSKVMTSVLNDLNHPFTQMVKWLIEHDIPDYLGQEIFQQELHYWLFWPLIGAGNRQRRQIWRESLLLFVAGLSEKGRQAIVAAIPSDPRNGKLWKTNNVLAIINKFAPEVIRSLGTS